MRQAVSLSLASSLLLSLVGCGGDSNSESPSPTPAAPQQVSVTAIDGYLSAAEVYLDRNDNQIADEDELLGHTDKQGKLVFSATADELTHAVIVQVVAGITADGDVGGYAANSYQMIANAGAKVVSPFSTIAVTQQLGLDELAGSVNLPAALLDSDYVAAKADSDEAKRAHLLARSVSALMAPELSQTAANELLLEQMDSVNALVQTAPLADIDSQLITLNNAGMAITTSMRPTLPQFLGNNSYYDFSFNPYWLNGCAQGCGSDDGRAYWQFDYANNSVSVDGATYTLHVEDDASFYLSGGDLPVGERSELQDKFIYVADGFAIVLSVDNDLHFYSALNPVDNQLSGLTGIDLTATAIADSVLYHLTDTRRLTDEQPWQSRPELSQPQISVANEAEGRITIGDADYLVVAANDDLYLLKAVADHQPSLLLKSADLAEFLLAQWSQASAVPEQD